ncbi:GNAT family N-acetyltransferase [Nocardioides insulae]|uniref:GNAT family N-acetyltransferase n=1 Tax=Nocardioides insulae TaxID=394734 RepID=UPI001FE181A4|nr:GNAT family N-acetyltransferase [Nocardioides insulae]
MPAVRADAPELLTLQLACWVQEALDNDTLDIPALHESLDDVLAHLEAWDVYVVRAAGRLVGSVSGHAEGDLWSIGRLMVAPDQQGRGMGRALLAHIESVAAPATTTYGLFTGERSARNHRIYKKAGYRLRGDLAAAPGAVTLTKRRR